jgi:hypothetical protein
VDKGVVGLAQKKDLSGPISVKVQDSLGHAYNFE